MTQLCVGITKIPQANKKKYRMATYSDVTFDKEQWAFTSLYLPIPYDLMDLLIEGLFKPLPGWWTGKSWMGLRFDESAQVIMWKRKL